MIKKINRFVLYPLIYKLGIITLLLKLNRKNRIICYHGVTLSPNFKLNNRHMPIEQFKKDLDFYHRHFEIVSLIDFFNIENKNKGQKPKVCITFDDGYMNNFVNVLPIAVKNNIPITFFIITASLFDSNFITWYDLLDFIKFGNPQEIKLGDDTYVRGNSGSYIYKDETIEERIKRSGIERAGLIDSLKTKYKNDLEKGMNKFPDYWQLVDQETLIHSSKNPLLYIGSHTHLHYCLGKINDELVVEELKKSRDILQSLCKYPISSIAFPDGSYNDKVKILAEQNLYSYQLAVNYQLPDDNIDKRIINRFSISNSTTHEANMIKLSLS